MAALELSNTADADPHIVLALTALAKKTQMAVRLRFAEIGLAPGDDEILTEIVRSGKANVTDLSRSLGVRSATIERAMARLVDIGMIEASSGSAFTLSAKGTQVVPQISVQRTRIATDLIRELGAARVQQLTLDVQDLDRGFDGILRAI